LKSSYGKIFKGMAHCVQTLNLLFRPHGGARELDINAFCKCVRWTRDSYPLVLVKASAEHGALKFVM
jgi:hypothetical protein